MLKLSPGLNIYMIGRRIGCGGRILLDVGFGLGLGWETTWDEKAGARYMYYAWGYVVGVMVMHVIGPA